MCPGGAYKAARPSAHLPPEGGGTTSRREFIQKLSCPFLLGKRAPTARPPSFPLAHAHLQNLDRAHGVAVGHRHEDEHGAIGRCLLELSVCSIEDRLLIAHPPGRAGGAPGPWQHVAAAMRGRKEAPRRVSPCPRGLGRGVGPLVAPQNNSGRYSRLAMLTTGQTLITPKHGGNGEPVTRRERNVVCTFKKDCTSNYLPIDDGFLLLQHPRSLSRLPHTLHRSHNAFGSAHSASRATSAAAAMKVRPPSPTPPPPLFLAGPVDIPYPVSRSRETLQLQVLSGDGLLTNGPTLQHRARVKAICVGPPRLVGLARARGPHPSLGAVRQTALPRLPPVLAVSCPRHVVLLGPVLGRCS